MSISNHGPNGIPTPSSKSLLSQNNALNLNQNLYRQTNGKPMYGSGPYYLNFEERVLGANFLCSDDKEPLSKIKTEPEKKEMFKYDNKDKLFIERPERVHRGIDISQNLKEEIKPVLTADLGIQSDEIEFDEDKKPFLPQKLGMDVGTQILDGELFCFNREVQPLLTVIVGKTLEQSLLELEQED